jgi:hypothetical protein
MMRPSTLRRSLESALEPERRQGVSFRPSLTFEAETTFAYHVSWHGSARHETTGETSILWRSLVTA